MKRIIIIIIICLISMGFTAIKQQREHRIIKLTEQYKYYFDRGENHSKGMMDTRWDGIREMIIATYHQNEVIIEQNKLIIEQNEEIKKKSY
jgi:predicted ATP-binding protein involved in virulence